MIRAISSNPAVKANSFGQKNSIKEESLKQNSNQGDPCMSRRGFLKNLGIGVAGVAIGGPLITSCGKNELEGIEPIDPIEPIDDPQKVPDFQKTYTADKKEYFFVENDNPFGIPGVNGLAGLTTIRVKDADVAKDIYISPQGAQDKFIRYELKNDYTKTYYSGKNNTVEVLGFNPDSEQSIEITYTPTTELIQKDANKEHEYLNRDNTYYKVSLPKTPNGTENTHLYINLGKTSDLSEQDVNETIAKIDEKIVDGRC